MDKAKVLQLICEGYVRQITQNMDDRILYIDIEKLCHSFCNDEEFMSNELESTLSLIANVQFEIITKLKKIKNSRRSKSKGVAVEEEMKKPKVTHCTLELDDTFNALNFYQKRLILRKILKQNKWPIHDLRVWKDDNTTAISEQFYFVEYVLLRRYHSICSLDLSQMDLTDNHLLFFCNLIADVMQYHTDKKKKKCTVSMKMTKINLSNNQLSDKYIAVFLRTIQKFMPKMIELDLSQNAITNRSLAVIMKYGIFALKIDLSACSGVTLKALNKYQRMYYDEEEAEKYVYCKQMVRFVNKHEEAAQNEQIARSSKRTAGKGQKFQAWNRKKGSLMIGYDYNLYYSD